MTKILQFEVNERNVILVLILKLKAIYKMIVINTLSIYPNEVEKFSWKLEIREEFL